MNRDFQTLAVQRCVDIAPIGQAKLFDNGQAQPARMILPGTRAAVGHTIKTVEQERQRSVVDVGGVIAEFQSGNILAKAFGYANLARFAVRGVSHHVGLKVVCDLPQVILRHCEPLPRQGGRNIQIQL